MDKYFEKKLLEEREYYYNKFYSPKAIFLNVITLGFYGWIKLGENGRRVGLW